MAQSDRGGIVTVPGTFCASCFARPIGRRERPGWPDGLKPLPVSLHNGEAPELPCFPVLDRDRSSRDTTCARAGSPRRRDCSKSRPSATK